MNSKTKNLQTLWDCTAGHRLLMLGGFGLLILELLLSFISPLILSVTIDSILGDSPLNVPWYFSWYIEALGGVESLKNRLWVMSVTMVGFQLLAGVLSFARPCLINLSAEGTAKSMRDRLYRHLQRLPFAYHVCVQTGDLIQRATSDVDTLRRFLTNSFLEFVRTILLLCIGLFVMLSLHVPLTLISFCLCPLLVIDSLWFYKKIKTLTDAFETQEGKVFTVIQENITGARVVRAFGWERYELDKMTVQNELLRQRQRSLNDMFAALWTSLDVICGIQIALVTIFGVWFAVRGEITLGQYTAFMSYIFIFLWPIRNFGRVLTQLGRAMVAMERITQVQEEPEEDPVADGLTPALRGDIRFDHVTFSYDGQPVLRDLSVHIQGGSTAAILGATGSGKSTLVQLLQRLYDPQEGRITIGGVDIQEMQKHHLRDRIGIVLQEPYLYSKTILQNIGIKQRTPDTAAIMEAAKTAAIHDDILAFQQGYDTIVGERGVTLSGGQKQRVSIARTLLCDSDILIFDDSLSAVDTQTDAQIRQALRQRRQGVTTIIISHRVTTLMEADQIFVLRDGQVAESGTHQELLALGGIYAHVSDLQNYTEEVED